jgi:glycosyltransferase involved in cell wall biosynthesis
MVQLLLKGFGGDQRKPATVDAAARAAHGIECYHVNAQVSKELEDIGDVRFGKLFLLVGYCLQAIWCHFRYGVSTLYYIPAPGKRSALYRDWLVMFLCRPFYKNIILHWHAAGLANWLETHVQIRSRSLTYRRMGNIALSIALSEFNRADAAKLLPKQIRVINNGIPDPCPDYEREILPRRRARRAAREKLAAGVRLIAGEISESGVDTEIFKVLYVAHCTREKGLFDAIKGVLRANQLLAERHSPITLKLMVAGNFVTAAERAEFDRILATPEGRKCVEYLGFVTEAPKKAALREADLFCFPTFYQNENQPVNLIEAMAFGLPILTTRWRSIPELFPAGYPLLVDIMSPEQIAAALVTAITGSEGESLRGIFLRNFSLEQYLSGLARAFHSVEGAGPDAVSFGTGQSKPNPASPR